MEYILLPSPRTRGRPDEVRRAPPLPPPRMARRRCKVQGATCLAMRPLFRPALLAAAALALLPCACSVAPCLPAAGALAKYQQQEPGRLAPRDGAIPLTPRAQEELLARHLFLVSDFGESTQTIAQALAHAHARLLESDLGSASTKGPGHHPSARPPASRAKPGRKRAAAEAHHDQLARGPYATHGQERASHEWAHVKSALGHGVADEMGLGQLEPLGLDPLDGGLLGGGVPSVHVDWAKARKVRQRAKSAEARLVKAGQLAAGQSAGQLAAQSNQLAQVDPFPPRPSGPVPTELSASGDLDWADVESVITDPHTALEKLGLVSAHDLSPEDPVSHAAFLCEPGC
jgi:hypothetical protein